ncbi:MAG: EAL domain-containing protein [Bacteroidales bacterium]|nr:EAL domain-containing protein [Clostridium sp.]MCM1203681.1 EAL domain-containing protein [Bacteroidales bacterium]
MEKNQMEGLVYQIMDLSEQAMFVFSRGDFRIVYANPKATAIFGEGFSKATCYEGVEAKQRPCLNCPFMNLEPGQEYTGERYWESFDMRTEVKANGLIWENGSQVVLCTILDSKKLLQVKRQQDRQLNEPYAEQLRLSGELYRTVVSQLKTIVFECNYQQKKFYVSPLFYEKFGVKDITNINFLQDKNTQSLIYEEDRETYQMLFAQRDNDFREVTCRLCEVDGRIVWYRICIQFICDEAGELIRVIGTLKDVDDVAKSHETLRYQADYDILTGIPNVNRFYIDAGRLVEEDEEKHYAIISFDIDKFKLINDLFGMTTGDEVLKHVAGVLKERLPKGALYCRVHSDVFFFCVAYTRRGDLIKLIEKVRKGIDQNEYSFDVNTTFGIYLAQDVSTPINLMCDRATLAERTVKGNAMNFCAFYDEQYREEILRTTEIEQDMNVAISDKQFVMYLQPKYSLITGKICGAEVLARWQHPVKGLIQPNDFIPLFERNGFILRLDEYMWEEACRTLSDWQKKGKKPIPLSVNISRYHIKNNDLVRVWKRLIKQYGIPTSSLTLEITETFFYDSADLYDVLVQLQGLGFRLEIDDFGAGYSSLNMIRQIPVDTIKIDKDFLDKKLATEKGKIVISHTIAMAKELKLSVVAEGVETKEHVEFLKSSECDIAQGYYFAKPMPLEEFNRTYFAE